MSDAGPFRLQKSRFLFLFFLLIGLVWPKSLMRDKGACEEREKKPPLSFSVSPQSRSPFSASLQTFCFTIRAYWNKQKYGLFAVYGPLKVVDWSLVRDKLDLL